MRSRRKSRGLNLLEVLVSVSLLVVGFLAVVGLFASNLQLVQRSSELTEAAEIGRHLLERVRLMAGGAPAPTVTFSPASVPLPGPPPFPPSPFPRVAGDSGRYELSVKVEATPRPKLKAIEVYVSWEGGKGLRLQTLHIN